MGRRKTSTDWQLGLFQGGAASQGALADVTSIEQTAEVISEAEPLPEESSEAFDALPQPELDEPDAAVPPQEALPTVLELPAPELDPEDADVLWSDAFPNAEEIQAAVARRPPAPKRGRHDGPRLMPEGWEESTEAVCTKPGCGRRGRVVDIFGFRRIPRADGSFKVIPQPQCTTCRGESTRRSAEKRAMKAQGQSPSEEAR